MTTTFAPHPSSATALTPTIIDRSSPDRTVETDDQPTHEATLDRLLGIEQRAQELWTVEPDCDIADRTLLMTRLTAVTRRIEHLVLRHQFHPDEPVDRHELGRCEKHLTALTAQWRRHRPDPVLAA